MVGLEIGLYFEAFFEGNGYWFGLLGESCDYLFLDGVYLFDGMGGYECEYGGKKECGERVHFKSMGYKEL